MTEVGHGRVQVPVNLQLNLVTVLVAQLSPHHLLLLSLLKRRHECCSTSVPTDLSLTPKGIALRLLHLALTGEVVEIILSRPLSLVEMLRLTRIYKAFNSCRKPPMAVLRTWKEHPTLVLPETVLRYLHQMVHGSAIASP